MIKKHNKIQIAMIIIIFLTLFLSIKYPSLYYIPITIIVSIIINYEEYKKNKKLLIQNDKKQQTLLLLDNISKTLIIIILFSQIHIFKEFKYPKYDLYFVDKIIKIQLVIYIIIAIFYFTVCYLKKKEYKKLKL